jgi:uncharacterized protein YjbJ (UPF0337 family)
MIVTATSISSSRAAGLSEPYRIRQEPTRTIELRASVAVMVWRALLADSNGHSPMTSTPLTIATVALAAVAMSACDRSHESGAAQKTIGQVESAAGDLTGSDKLKHAGKHDEVVGGVKSAVGDVKDTVKDAIKK